MCRCGCTRACMAVDVTVAVAVDIGVAAAVGFPGHFSSGQDFLTKHGVPTITLG